MKTVRILLALSLCVVLEKGLSAETPLKVLFIGNSQTCSFRMPQMIDVMSKSAPADHPKLEIAQGMVWGTGFKGYWDAKEYWDYDLKVKRGAIPTKGTIHALIASKKWDYVVLQEEVDAPVERFREYATRFDEEIKKTGAKTILFATAVGKRGYPRGFVRLNDMQIAYGKEKGIPVAAAGYVWMNYLGPNPSEEQLLDLYHPDRGHPGPKGTYIYACLLYATLTGKTPEGLACEFKDIRDGIVIPKEEAAKMQKLAWQEYQERIQKSEATRVK